MEPYKYTSGSFIGKGGDEIFYQKWVAPRQKGIVVIAHGLGEHSGRYMNLINEMRDTNISFYAIDHRGHGRSGGERGHVDFFMDYVHDLKLFINFIREENNRMHVVLLGHSLGGVIAFKYALKYPEDLKGLILSSPALILTTSLPSWKEWFIGTMSKYMPGYSASNELNADDLSHDKAVVQAYIDDPLVHDKVTARFYTELSSASQECLVRAYELRMPLLIFHGSADRIASIIGSEKTYENASSASKEYHPLRDLYHETMNEAEPERSKVLSMVSGWILKHTHAKPSSQSVSEMRKKPKAAKASSPKKHKAAKSAKAGKTAKPKVSRAKKKTAKK